MKNLKKIGTAVVMLMMGFTSVVMAQPTEKGAVPITVISSFSKKYPNAQLKKWDMKNGFYTAKAIMDNHKYFVSFDKNGNWVSTASNIQWKVNLPKNIKNAYNKSQYNTWNVYYSKKVEKPAGEYYQLMVDDTNLHIGQHSRPVYTIDKLLEFKADGTLAMVMDISKDPAP